MTQVAKRLLLRVLAIAVCMGVIAGCSTTSAQSSPARFDRQALDSMLAPIALYPDALLSQVLMASTYPREVEQAAGWSRARPGLSGDAAVRTSEGWDWDPSVRSLLAFPLVLDTMAGHMRWTEDLGDAFLVQPEDVMDAVQRLRLRAYDTGNLRSSEHIRVINSSHGIVIESAAPQLVHVPYYDPRITYGTWWWPTQPVYWARWPGYYDPPDRTYLMHWGPGIGISTGFFFGGFVWPRREVRVVNVNTYYYTRRVFVERPVEIHRHTQPHAAHARDIGPGLWRHDASRRHGPDRREPRIANERPAPIATRAAEIRREPVTPAPARALALPNRTPDVVPMARPQRRESTQATLSRDAAASVRVPESEAKAATSPEIQPRRNAVRNEKDDGEHSAPRAERRVEPRTTPPAAIPQAQRRAERQESRDEQRAARAQTRDDSRASARQAQDNPKSSERTVAPERRSERGNSGASGTGRSQQRAPDPGRPG